MSPFGGQLFPWAATDEGPSMYEMEGPRPALAARACRLPGGKYVSTAWAWSAQGLSVGNLKALWLSTGHAAVIPCVPALVHPFVHIAVHRPRWPPPATDRPTPARHPGCRAPPPSRGLPPESGSPPRSGLGAWW